MLTDVFRVLRASSFEDSFHFWELKKVFVNTLMNYTLVNLQVKLHQFYGQQSLATSSRTLANVSIFQAVNSCPLLASPSTSSHLTVSFKPIKGIHTRYSFISTNSFRHCVSSYSGFPMFAIKLDV